MKQPEMSEEERKMWQTAYSFHEAFLNGEWTDEKIARFHRALAETDSAFHGHPLMRGLLVAVFDHFEAQIKAEGNAEPVQTRMEAF